MSSIVRQKDTASLIRNGNFVAGTSGWSGLSRHIVVSEQQQSSANLVSAPHYAAVIPEDSEITQDVSRSDLYEFPSRRFVTKAQLVPFGLDTYKLVVTSATRIDGTPAVADSFLFSDDSGEVALIPGQQIEVADTDRDANGGHYRIGSLFDDGSVEVSPIEHGITVLATEATHDLTYTSNGLKGTATLTGNVSFSRQLDNSTSQVGPKVSDILILDDPSFAVARVSSVSVSGSVVTCNVHPVAGAPFFPSSGGDPDHPDEAVSTDWRLSPTSIVNFQRPLGVYQYSFTLALSHYPDDYDGAPSLSFVSRIGSKTTEVPVFQLDGGVNSESLSLSSTGHTAYQRKLYWFFLESRVPIDQDLRLTVPGGSLGVSVGDVVLYRGRYANRHDFDDRDDPNTSVVADQRTALDRMLHGTDEYACAVPVGTVLLYTGGPVCPPGFKAVDGLAQAAAAGTETLPAPSTFTYDEARNRTVIEWDSDDFPILDSAGRSQIIPGDSEQVQVTLPIAAPFFGATEAIPFGATYQRPQPGMSLRVRSSNIDDNLTYDYSVPIRQAFVSRVNLSGSAGAIAGSLNDLLYPFFLSASQFSQGEASFTPVGPAEVDQPVVYTGPAVGSTPRGTSSNPAVMVGLHPQSADVTLQNVGLTGIAVDDVVYLRWQSDATVATSGGSTTPAYFGSFIAVVTSSQNGGNVTFARFDGNGMVLDGAVNGVRGTAYITDARAFGSDVLVTATSVNGQNVWSARRFKTSTIITVFSDITLDLSLNHEDGIVLEPSAFIRYGDSDFDLGDRGHSHVVSPGDAEFDANVAPHVNSNHDTLPVSIVARNHGHGYMDKYHHVIPRFFAAIPCIKL